MTAHPKPTHPVEQIVGDVKAVLKSLGPHGRLVVTVEKFDGCLLHRVERSKLTEEDLDRLMRQVPRPRSTVPEFHEPTPEERAASLEAARKAREQVEALARGIGRAMP
jgi:hypothetical protein